MRHLLRLAFPPTIPVLTGYFFMGAAFGVLLVTQGFNPAWAPLMGLVVYAGSGQFVAVGLLAAGFDPLGMFTITLLVNARHIFYALANLERFANFGRYRPYLILSLTDETFALFASTPVPEGVEERKFLTAIAALDQSYWIIGCGVGAFAGTLIHFDVRGIEFIMTALFIVILAGFLEKPVNRTPALIGLCVSMAVLIVCRLFFTTSAFILVAMAVLLVVFTIVRPKLEKQPEVAND